MTYDEAVAAAMEAVKYPFYRDNPWRGQLKQAVLRAMLDRPGWFYVRDLAMVTHGDDSYVTQCTLRPVVASVVRLASEFLEIRTETRPTNRGGRTRHYLVVRC